MKYTHMHVDFATIPPPYLWVLVPHEEERDVTLLIGVRYRCREMVLGGTCHDIIEEIGVYIGGMKRITSFGNTLSLFILTSQNPPCSFLLLARKQQQHHPVFPHFLHSLSLSLSFSLSFPHKTFLTSFIQEKDFLYMFYLLQRPSRIR